MDDILCPACNHLVTQQRGTTIILRWGGRTAAIRLDAGAHISRPCGEYVRRHSWRIGDAIRTRMGMCPCATHGARVELVAMAV